MTRHGWARGWFAALLVVGTTGCGEGGQSSPTAASAASAAPAPCDGNPAVEVELGSPYLDVDAAPAYVTTSGAPFFITAQRYESGGVLDPPRGRTSITFGPADVRPSYDPQRATVGGAVLDVQVPEGEYARVELPAGRYWVLSTTGGDLRAVSCVAGGLSDPARG